METKTKLDYRDALNWKNVGLMVSSICYGILLFHFYKKYQVDLSKSMLLRRTVYSGLIYLFVEANIVLDKEKMYEFIFKYRFIIAFSIFVFLILNKINFSSSAQYDLYIQPGLGNAYTQPVFGKSNAIRSDEWLVNVSRTLAGSYNNYGPVNNIVRATATDNLSASGYRLGYWAFANPSSWGYYLLGPVYGLSYMWAYYLVFGFLSSFELSYIITRKKMLSLLGGALIFFSGFNLWWSFVPMIIAGNAAIALVWHFFKEQERKKKILFGLGTAVTAASFVIVLYPAWQVPAGYVYLMLLIWVIRDRFEDIKKNSRFDWILTIICILFMISTVASYLWQYRFYMTAVMGTVYPGRRVTYGRNTINKLLNYLVSFSSEVFPYGNPCELATFFTLFPLGFVLSIWTLIKKRGKDSFLLLMAVPTILIGWYCYTEMPHGLAKVLLLTFAVPERAVDILGFICVILLIYSLGQDDEVKLPWLITLLLTGVTLYPAIKVARNHPEITKKNLAFIILVAIYCLFVVSLLAANIKKERLRAIRPKVMCVTAWIIIAVGMQVHPVMIGLNSIFSKPVSTEIQKIVKEEPDSKWIALGDIVAPNYLIACGARTYNSVNYIPNMEFWKKLDPTGQYDEVYNRYAHICVNLVEDDTEIILKQADVINLNLSIKDLEKLDVDYFMSQAPLKSDEGSAFNEMYNYGGIYIYKYTGKSGK